MIVAHSKHFSVFKLMSLRAVPASNIVTSLAPGRNKFTGPMAIAKVFKSKIQMLKILRENLVYGSCLEVT